jgi:large repetitive protein
MKIKFVVASVAVVLFCFLSVASFANKIPQDFSNVEYFYVFGPDGNPRMGAQDGKFELFIDVDSVSAEDIKISVFDPDTSGKKDWLYPKNGNFNTVTKFSVYGQELLDEKTVTREWDYKYLTFGPYSKTSGMQVEGNYRFRVVVETLEGDDANLFKFKISPDSAEVFSYNLTFRLASNFGEKMYFYPEIPARTRRVVVENYDLDRNGGTSILYDTASREITDSLVDFASGGKYEISGSESGQWKKTTVSLSNGPSRRLEYVITKRTQRHAHAGLRVSDRDGKYLPIYFSKSKPLKNAGKIYTTATGAVCNTFTFDATGSYDPDKGGLSFLWNFGDGDSSNDPVVKHTFIEAGDYTVTLTVVDGSGLDCDTAITAQKVKVNLPPKADFRLSDSACINETITFDAGLTKDNNLDDLIYYWDLGDGSSVQGKSVTKSYDKGGRYEVTLMVDDNQKTACSRDMIKRSVKINTPPRAYAGKDINMCLDSFDDEFNIIFDASASSDADGDSLQYYWDFGDGANGEGKTVTHRYTKNGTYEASLRVNDSSQTSCSVSTDKLSLTLNKRPGADVSDQQSVCVGDAVQFEGASSSSNEDDFSFSWDFGDGSRSQGKTPEHIYKKGGLYKVIFAVDDNKGMPCSTSADIVNVDVNTQPLAKLQRVKPVCQGEAIYFDASASYDTDGDFLTYKWDFDDGTSETGSSKVTHVYEKGGNYTVGVTVDDNKARRCSIDRDVISCKVNTPPIADPGLNLVCCEGKIVHFDGSKSYDPDGDMLEYYWNFGDGSSARGEKVTHTYTKRGTYNVMLTVDDSSKTPCSVSSAGFEAKVNAMPISVIKIR